MKLSHKARVIVIYSLTVFAMLLLAAGISGIINAPVRASEPLREVSPFWAWLIALFQRGQNFYMTFFLVLFALAVLSIFFTRTGRKWFSWFLLLLAFLFFTLFLRPPRQALKATPTLIGTPLVTVSPTAQSVTTTPLIPKPVVIPAIADWIVTLLGIFLAVLVVAFFALVLFWLSRRRSRLTFSEMISQQAQEALDALESGGDFQDVVIRCYAQMSRTLAERRDLRRESAMTPREFERILIRSGFPEDPVRALTRLFEAVRYGTFQPDPASVQVAVDSLGAIVAHCQTVDDHTGG